MALEAAMSVSAPAKLLPDPRRAPLAATLLAVLLFVAQLGFLLHGLEHDAAEPDAYCALCVASQHVGDAMPMSAVVAPDAARAPAPSAMWPAPVRAAPLPSFRARAPPVPSLS